VPSAASVSFVSRLGSLHACYGFETLRESG
jgi:hypothetical protein